MTSILQARPTLYKGIQMRSRFEAGFAAWLDDCEFSWAYEPGAFASPKGQYLPDFRIDGLRMLQAWEELGVVARTTYVETKPHELFHASHLEIKQRMTIIHATDPEARLLIVTEKMTCLGFKPDPDNPESGYMWFPMVWAFGFPPVLTYEGPQPLQNEYWKG